MNKNTVMKGELLEYQRFVLKAVQEYNFKDYVNDELLNGIKLLQKTIDFVDYVDELPIEDAEFGDDDE